MIVACHIRRVNQTFVTHLLKRWTHSELVRVRFAPSPTGDLHLGGLRTALYNFLFARSRNGKFLLRIEDTDQTRLVPGAAERLVDDLLWAGIEIDEGPNFGGGYGPYIQSQRSKIYADAVEKLLSNGSAYRCFCTERRLDLVRKEAVRARQVPKYDNKCRHLSSEQVQELLKKGTPYCVRFKLTEDVQPILHDLIYGRVEHNVAETEGDPVIMKSDQLPTYHLANVVDDHLMGITHVLRGVEWQVSTPKHLLLYRAFGWQPPAFGHLPLLVNADGSKLSKRQGDIGIRQFREKGYFPEALVNYVVSAGGGFLRPPAADSQDIYTLKQLAQQFDLNRVNSHPSRLNPIVLEDFNRSELLRRLSQPAESDLLVAEVQQLVQRSFSSKSEDLYLQPEHIQQVLQWVAQRLSRLEDLTSPKLSFLWVKPAADYRLNGLTPQQCDKLLALLQINTKPFTKDTLNRNLKAYAKEEKLNFAALMKELRAALSGLQQGPGVAEMMEILGQQTVLQRIQAAIPSTQERQKETL